MRQVRMYVSTGVIALYFPMTMTIDDLQDFENAMAVTLRTLKRTATNGHPSELGATGVNLITHVPAFSKEDGT